MPMGMPAGEQAPVANRSWLLPKTLKFLYVKLDILRRGEAFAVQDIRQYSSLISANASPLLQY